LGPRVIARIFFGKFKWEKWEKFRTNHKATFASRAFAAAAAPTVWNSQTKSVICTDSFNILQETRAIACKTA